MLFSMQAAKLLIAGCCTWRAAVCPLQNSLMQQSMLCQDAAAVPRVQIVPVLRCSGQTGAALVLHCCSLAAVQGLGQEAAAGVDVTLLLQPVSIWCTLPLLAHLQSFAAPVASELQPANGAAPSMQPNNASSGKAAVAAAISDILEQKPSGRCALPAALVPSKQMCFLPYEFCTLFAPTHRWCPAFSRWLLAALPARSRSSWRSRLAALHATASACTCHVPASCWLCLA